MVLDLSNWFIDENDRSQRFHAFHGPSVSLQQNPRVIRRLRGFRGICFGEKPLEPLRPLMVHIDEIELGWTGHLRLGVTKMDPNKEPDLDSTLFSQNTSLIAFPQSFSAHTRAGDVVGVYYEVVDANFIQVHMIVNGMDICPKQDLLPYNSSDKLFVVVDVFGMTKRITMIPLKKSVRTLSSICEQVILSAVDRGLSPESLPLPVKDSIVSLYLDRRLITV